LPDNLKTVKFEHVSSSANKTANTLENLGKGRRKHHHVGLWLMGHHISEKMEMEMKRR